jgi:EAL domain-containing protein (putative c-di-GMP-specific phosphodiesterase class I)
MKQASSSNQRELLAEATLPTVLLQTAKASDTSIDDILRDALHTIRQHLGMDVAFISEFLDGRRIFRYVDAVSDAPPINEGGSDPLEESYCQSIVDGRLPRLIHDASLIPFALTFPATTALPVGAHISVPIRLNDGDIYGTFCCFKTTPDMTLLDRDLALMEIFAEFTGKQLDRQLALGRSHSEMTERVQNIITTGNFALAYQPIFDFTAGRIVGFEALARFATAPIRPPNIWFDEAVQTGLAETLEGLVITEALRNLAQLPQDTYLTLNVSPATVLSSTFIPLIGHAPLDRIVLEITEHVSIPDYGALQAALAPLREHGMRLAVDDAGAGYASFRHILQLSPELIKLDISLTRDIDTDQTRRALAAALIRFAEETGSKVIAEGVETEAELATLQELRTNKAQGYLIGRPVPLNSALTLLQSRAYGDTTP